MTTFGVPHKDPPGTVRQNDKGHSVVKGLNDHWFWMEARLGKSIYVYCDDVQGFPIIGTVPGSPAARIVGDTSPHVQRLEAVPAQPPPGRVWRGEPGSIADVVLTMLAMVDAGGR